MAKAPETTVADVAPTQEPEPTPASPPETKTVSLLVDHVFLPEDPTQPDWASSTETVKCPAEVNDYRLKYEVHHKLADFLVKRKQAIEVPPDKD